MRRIPALGPLGIVFGTWQAYTGVHDLRHERYPDTPGLGRSEIESFGDVADIVGGGATALGSAAMLGAFFAGPAAPIVLVGGGALVVGGFAASSVGFATEWAVDHWQGIKEFPARQWQNARNAWDSGKKKLRSFADRLGF
jgi:hypothetical protein